MGSSDYIMVLEDRCYKANITSLELLQTVRIYEARYEKEIDTLKAYVIDLKSRVPNFVATKGDLVDKSLAEYINALPNRQLMKLMFLRL